MQIPTQILRYECLIIVNALPVKTSTSNPFLCAADFVITHKQQVVVSSSLVAVRQLLGISQVAVRSFSKQLASNEQVVSKVVNSSFVADMQLLGSCQVAVRQLLGSCYEAVRQLLGCYQLTIRKLLVSYQVAVRQLSFSKQ